MIKNLILDFGDIFINLDKTATAKAMQQYGFTSITPELDTLFKTYEKGLITTALFLEKTATIYTKASQEDLIAAWNAILLDFPEYRLTYLEALKASKKYRLYLLSNTNHLHITHIKQEMGIARYQRFMSCFDGFYLSHEIHKRKPDSVIYEFVLKENNLKAAETLFVDDTKENTDAAAKLGILTWHLKVGEEDIIDLKSKL